jgi:hypothetical protein
MGQSSAKFLLKEFIPTALLLVAVVAQATEVSDGMLVEFSSEALQPFTAQAGLTTWTTAQANGRSCESCHGESLFARGSHYKTGEIIEPMAPSINSERLTDRRKINKWFLRNCKWTYGRECTAQEKGDILLWLSQQ